MNLNFLVSVSYHLDSKVLWGVKLHNILVVCKEQFQQLSNAHTKVVKVMNYCEMPSSPDTL